MSKIKGVIALEKEKIVDTEKLVSFIYSCYPEFIGTIDKETIETVLDLEEKYLRTIGIVTDK